MPTRQSRTAVLASSSHRRTFFTLWYVCRSRQGCCTCFPLSSLAALWQPFCSSAAQSPLISNRAHFLQLLPRCFRLRIRVLPSSGPRPVRPTCYRFTGARNCCSPRLQQTGQATFFAKRLQVFKSPPLASPVQPP